MPDADALAAAVKLGVDALRRGDAVAAAHALAPVANDEALENAPDLVDIRARVLVLYAQALVAADRFDDAQPALVQALRAVKRLDDDEGVAAVRGLQQLALHSRAKARGTPAAAPAGTAPSPDDAEALLIAANAATGEQAARLGEQAFALAVAHGSVREEVLARLVLARSRPDAAADQLAAALRRARGAGEFTLVGAVVRAAELAGVALPQEPYAGRAV